MADKPKAATRAAPAQQDISDDILSIISGTVDRGAHGCVGNVTAQRIIDTLADAGYSIVATP